MGRFSGRPRAGQDHSRCECCIAVVNLNIVSNKQGGVTAVTATQGTVRAGARKRRNRSSVSTVDSEERGPTAGVAGSGLSVQTFACEGQALEQVLRCFQVL